MYVYYENVCVCVCERAIVYITPEAKIITCTCLLFFPSEYRPEAYGFYFMFLCAFDDVP